MSRTLLMLGSISAFLAVGLGAFGAHLLKDKLSAEMIAVYETAVQYHMAHALGLILVGIIAHWMAESQLILWSGISLAVGILLFSGSLYSLSLSGIRIFGAITPIGGLAFLTGWLLLAIAVYREL